MRRRRLADLAVATLATLVVAVVVRGAIGVSSSSVVGRSAAVQAARTPLPSLSPAVATSSTPALTTVRPPTVLFVGEKAALKPRGGSAASFACRAAITLGWQCEVLTRTPGTDVPGRAAPTASTRATPSEIGGQKPDYVVVTTATDDTAAEIRGVLDRLPPAFRTASIILLGPITPASARIQRLTVNERRLAAEHNAAFIDPVAERWIVAATRGRYLNGEQLSSAGIRVAAARLASDLRRASASAPSGGG